MVLADREPGRGAARRLPKGVFEEYLEAQLCLSATAWRGAAALLRSTLEKVLLENGYNEKDLFKKIEAAKTDARSPTRGRSKRTT